MKSLSEFFTRYTRMSPPDMIIRDSVVLLFDKHLSYSISREQVKVRSKVVYVDCPSLIKTELSLHKRELLDELSLLVTPHKVSDIR
jgi:hypothetical protein